MISIRSALLTAVLGLGVMACVNEPGRAQSQMPETTSATANYDPSTLYQPSPNAQRVAVSPSTPQGGSSDTTAGKNCDENAPRASAGAAIVSPNLRLCP